MSLYLTNAQFFEQCIGALKGSEPTVVTTACTWASTTADSFLRKRYFLPLIEFDVDLTQQVFYLAQWKVATQIGFRPASGQNEILRVQFEDAMKWLGQVSTGLAEINCIDSTPDVDEEGTLAASDPPVSFHDVFGSRNRDCW